MKYCTKLDRNRTTCGWVINNSVHSHSCHPCKIRGRVNDTSGIKSLIYFSRAAAAQTGRFKTFFRWGERNFGRSHNVVCLHPSSMLPKCVLGVRYIASFRNWSASKAKPGLNCALFDPPSLQKGWRIVWVKTKFNHRRSSWMFQISHILISFETWTRQRRLESKIKAQFGTVWSPCKI